MLPLFHNRRRGSRSGLRFCGFRRFFGRRGLLGGGLHTCFFVAVFFGMGFSAVLVAVFLVAAFLVAAFLVAGFFVTVAFSQSQTLEQAFSPETLLVAAGFFRFKGTAAFFVDAFVRLQWQHAFQPLSFWHFFSSAADCSFFFTR